MIVIFKTLLTGLICGAIFAFFKLPIPAPKVLAGVIGIFGIYLGYYLVNKLLLN